MVANVDAMVRAGIEAYRGGKKAEARKLLEKAIELDDYNEQAWMWLSAVVETQEEKRTCLENVLVINPDNEEAKRGLKMLGVDGGGASAPPPVADNADDPNPFTDTGMADFGDADFTADTGNDSWADPPTATSSASSVYQGPETSEHEYDSWVNNLNLGGGSGESVEEDIIESGSDDFSTDDMGDLFGLDDGDDIFGTDDPFGSEPQFSDDTMEPSDSFMSGPFGGNDNDDFGIDNDPSPIAPSQSATPVKSPGAENFNDDLLFNELDNAEFSGGDFITGDEDFDNSAQPDFTPDELFSFIPEEIGATRLPGIQQGVSPVSIVILIVLVALNLGAVMFIMSSIG